MKKILSLSIIALLAMAPTMGWAEPTVIDAVDEDTGNPDPKTYDYEFAVPNYDMDAAGNPRYDSNGAIQYLGRQGPSNTARNLVDQNGPIYKGVNVSAEDGKKVSAVSYVKGAYNDVITKINGVNNSLEVYTTWGNASEHKTAVRKD